MLIFLNPVFGTTNSQNTNTSSLQPLKTKKTRQCKHFRIWNWSMFKIQALKNSSRVEVPQICTQTVTLPKKKDYHHK